MARAKPSTRDDIRAAGGSQYTIENWGGRDAPMFVTEFDSLSDFADFNDTATEFSSWHLGTFKDMRGIEASRTAVRDGHAPNEVFEQYVALRGQLDAHVNELSASMPSAKRKRVRGIEGDEISIERVMVHDTDVWERRVRGAARQTVRIALNVSHSAGTSQNEIVRGTVQGVALADVLQALGHTVEITAVEFSAHSANGFAQHTPGAAHYAITAGLKSSLQPLDAQQLLCSSLPAIDRVMAFGIFGTYTPGLAEGSRLYVDRVTKKHTDHFGIDVFSAGNDFRYTGPDSESIVAQCASKIEALNWID